MSPNTTPRPTAPDRARRTRPNPTNDRASAPPPIGGARTQSGGSPSDSDAQTSARGAVEVLSAAPISPQHPVHLAVCTGLGLSIDHERQRSFSTADQAADPALSVFCEEHRRAETRVSSFLPPMVEGGTRDLESVDLPGATPERENAREAGLDVDGGLEKMGALSRKRAGSQRWRCPMENCPIRVSVDPVSQVW